MAPTIVADVEELGSDLRVYLDRVRAGEQVVATEGGREIARLIPTPSPGTKDAAYADLVARGLIIPPERETSGEDLPLVPVAGGTLLQALLPERTSNYGCMCAPTLWPKCATASNDGRRGFRSADVSPVGC